MKLKEKNQAIILRKIGKSYSEIGNELKVSKGTLSLWLKDIKLAPEQEKRLYVTLKQKNVCKLARFKQEEKRRKIENILAEAKKTLIHFLLILCLFRA